MLKYNHSNYKWTYNACHPCSSNTANVPAQVDIHTMRFTVSIVSKAWLNTHRKERNKSKYKINVLYNNPEKTYFQYLTYALIEGQNCYFVNLVRSRNWFHAYHEITIRQAKKQYWKVTPTSTFNHIRVIPILKINT